jgi:hypothetical protein
MDAGPRREDGLASHLWRIARVARFSSVQNTKMGKNATNGDKIYGMAIPIPFNYKIYRMVKKHTIIFHSQAFQNLPIFRLIPSGNPADDHAFGKMEARK